MPLALHKLHWNENTFVPLLWCFVVLCFFFGCLYVSSSCFYVFIIHNLNVRNFLFDFTGMDAQVAYGFHNLRNEKPYLANGPIANKVLNFSICWPYVLNFFCSSSLVACFRLLDSINQYREVIYICSCPFLLIET